jgi:hypothetical protein
MLFFVLVIVLSISVAYVAGCKSSQTEIDVLSETLKSEQLVSARLKNALIDEQANAAELRAQHDKFIELSAELERAATRIRIEHSTAIEFTNKLKESLDETEKSWAAAHLPESVIRVFDQASTAN